MKIVVIAEHEGQGTSATVEAELQAGVSTNGSIDGVALAAWYDSHPSIRRLLAIRSAQGLRVIIALEPTMDGDDAYPSWIAHHLAWAKEINMDIGVAVQLEFADENTDDRFHPEADCEVIAASAWRDPTTVD